MAGSLPLPAADQVYVQVSGLEGGHLTLPERLFVTDPDPERRVTVPSMSFLVQHPGHKGQSPSRLVFDLGMKRNLSQYPPALQSHVASRMPAGASPDVRDSLRSAGLDPAKDIDVIMYSHVHWDHVGTPTDFPAAKFVVGSGTLHVLDNGAPHFPADTFDPNLLPRDRTFELPPVPNSGREQFAASQQTNHKWIPMAGFPNVTDFYGDGSLYVIDSPGHLYGHVNLLARLSATRWLLCGGDCCHDYRILTGTKGIGLYDDGHGNQRSAHVDTQQAAATLARIRALLNENQTNVKIEAVIAHDAQWRVENRHRFLPNFI